MAEGSVGFHEGEAALGVNTCVLVSLSESMPGEHTQQLSFIRVEDGA
jgi:hypothetical protein